MADLDGDGRTDLLSGDFFGRVHWFQRAVEGGFEAPVVLQGSDGHPLDAGDASCVFPFDLDRDGRLDLVLGNMDGGVALARGLDHESDEPRFALPEPLKSLDGPIAAPSGDSAPLLGDWDGDGREDLLLAAQDGSVRLRRDLAAEGPARFGLETVLIEPVEWGSVPQGRSDKRVKLDLVDWNADGHLDLLVGDVSFQPGSPADQEEYAEVERALRSAEAAMEKHYVRQRERAQELYGPKGEDGLDGPRWAESIRAAMKELEREPEYLADAERHLEAVARFTRVDTKTHEAGRVWVYLRRPSDRASD